MRRTTRINTRIDARRAATVGLTSFATLTLAPLLAHAKPNERALLLLAAVPAAALFGYLAGYAAGSTAGSTTHLHAAAPQAAALQAAQVSNRQLRAAQLQAAQPSAPVIRLISEPIPQSGPGSPVGSGHLAALARPPAEPRHELQHGLHLVPTPSREASTLNAPATGLDDSSPHLTLIVTQPPVS